MIPLLHPAGPDFDRDDSGWCVLVLVLVLVLGFKYISWRWKPGWLCEKGFSGTFFGKT